MRRTLLAATFSLLACAGSGSATLTVALETDLQPFVDFDEVDVQWIRGDAIVAMERVEVGPGDDVSRGFDLATFATGNGRAEIAVRLYGSAGEVGRRRAFVDVRGDTRAVILVSAECGLGEACPGEGDSLDATECIAGACFPPTCLGRDCLGGGGSCDLDADCDPRDGCSSGSCSRGRCVVTPDDGACAAGQRCVVGVGCTSGGGCDDPGPEVCNGVDDDCDASTPDGAEDPMLGESCDGDDADLCTRGSFVCVGGALVCEETGPEATETCDGTDEDCDGLIDETGDEAWYPDEDGDGYGDEARVELTCERPGPEYVSRGGDCADRDENVFPDSPEGCNAADDDCDGEIDEGGCVGCESHTTADVVFLVCRTSRRWTDAVGLCEGGGYELARIDSAARQAELEGAFAATGISGSFWIGYNDRSTEGIFRWADGSASGYDNWASGEPDDGGTFGTENCALVSSSDGLWRDEGCGSEERYVCTVER